MSQSGSKVRIFSLEKVLKTESVTLSVFIVVCWHQMTENSFKRYLLIYLRPLSSVPKSKVGKSRAHANRLGEYICRLSVKS